MSLSTLFCPTPPSSGIFDAWCWETWSSNVSSNVAGRDHADCSVPKAFAKHCSGSLALQNREIPVKIRFLNLSSIEQMVFV